MPPQDAVRRRLSSRVVSIGMVGALSTTLVACSSSSTRAVCVDRQGNAGVLASTRGGYLVVPDSYCDNGGSFGRYFWYYGGRGYYSNGHYYYRSGSTIKPRNSRITTRSGKSLSHGTSRGGFGGHSHGGS
jgi:hypothetical protein